MPVTSEAHLGVARRTHAMPESPTKASVVRMRSRRRVALLIESSNAYARHLLLGVVGYIREHAPWSFYLIEQGRGDDPPVWLARWKGDGIIARIESARIAAAVVKSGLPAVDVSAGRFVPSLPWVETDDRAIAALAAQHLLERGFKHLAFCGDDRFAWSRQRGEAFTSLVRQSGATLHVAPSTTDEEPARATRALQRWLRSLPRPVGVFACYDIRGQQVLDACRHLGLAVPEEVAVVGVDNDELLCELADPPLSSVIPDARRAGYEAAALLDRLMQGHAPASLETRIPPLGLRARQSTDMLAIEDPHVVQALRFIREHACDPIDVADVLRVVPVSRRVLEKRFLHLLHRTPHAEIVATKLARVRSLLTETKLPIDEIARRSGFAHTEYLSVVFKRELGVSPRDYRRQQQQR